MNYLICALLTFFTYSTFGQVSSSDKKKIIKIVGEDFVEVEAKSIYLSQLPNESISVDTSIFVLGDTTGIHLNNEYILFRDSIQFREDKELLCLVKSSPTTIFEYQEFKEYVRDSIARSKIIRYFSIDEVLNFINAPKKFKRDKSREFKGDRDELIRRFGINWDAKFSYSEDWYLPVFSDMYVPIYQRYRNQKIFEERKWVYRQKEIAEVVWNDYSVWSRNATHDFDVLGVLSQIYDQTNNKNPVVGVSGTQAKAFCTWKQGKLQREADRAGLNFTLVITLPTIDQTERRLNTFKIEERDYTDQWRITKREYQQFMDYVFDSITRTMIYFNVDDDRKAAKFIQHVKFFYCDYGEFEEFSPSNDRDYNFKLFHLNTNRKINKRDPEIQKIVKKTEKLKAIMTYSYARMLTRQLSEPLDLVRIPRIDKGRYIHVLEMPPQEVEAFTKLDVPLNFVYESWGPLACCMNRYFSEHTIEVMLPDSNLKGEPNELLPELAYEQALAFYNWKYPIDKFDSEQDDWQGFVYPSKEQFEQIQNGESIITESRTVDYPTPLFRYVVHIYPK